MKKIFIVLSTLALAIGCQVFEPETPVAPVTVNNAPTIAVSELSDSSFMAIIVPSYGTGYYSYAIYEGDTTTLSLNANTIFNVDKQALYAGTSKDDKIVVATSNLKPFTPYVIAAVAASTQGTISESISVKQVSTSDNVAPYLTDFAVQDTLVAIQWSEDVEVAGDAVIAVYGFNDPDAAYSMAGKQVAGVGKPCSTFKIPAEDIIVKGRVVYITVPGLQPGAAFQVIFSKGFVKDYAGFTNEKAHQGYFGVYGGKFVDLYKDLYGADKSKYIDYFSIYGRKATTTFEIPEYSPVIAPGTWEDTTFAVEVSSPYGPIVFVNDEAKVVSTVDYTDTKSYVVKSAFQTKLAYYDEETGCICYTIPDEPGFGYYCTVEVAEDALEDLYGNSSQAWSVESLYSYGFSLDDLFGEYSCKAYSPYSSSPNYRTGAPITAEFAFEKTDSVGFDVVCTKWIGMEAEIYGNFNTDNGRLNLEPLYYIPINDDLTDSTYTVYYAVSYGGLMGDKTTPYTFYLTAPGVISDCSDYFGWYYDFWYIPEDGIGAINWNKSDAYDYDIYYPVTNFVRKDAAASSASCLTKNHLPEVQKIVK